MREFFSHLYHELDLPLTNPVLIFSLILFIILLAPMLLKRLNMPGIIGLIISGILIGPHGLNILNKSSAVDLFSTIGLLYIMFIAGLDLDMNEFRVHRNKSLIFGFFTFIIPLAIGFPVCRYYLGYDFDAALLTASMFSTHTLVAYPIVSKLGVSKNQAVAVAVGGTILTDTAVLILLAIIMGKHAGSLDGGFWLRLGGSLAIFSAVMFLLIPRIAKWFFRKLESEKHAHYIFVLSVVFFSAFLAEVGGVEPIIGAFVAGLALNRLIPHSSALMNRIEFMGNALFIPFFLISVGMIVDVRVLLNGSTALIVAATLSVVALIGKWLAAALSQWIFRFSAAQRQLVFGLSSAHAAATLAVILVGFKAGILDENILNGTIILILITCIVASIATERAAKNILLHDSEGAQPLPSAGALTSEHILIPISNIQNMEKLLDFALLIKDKKSANPISLLSVVPNNEEAETNIARSKNQLEAYVKQASATESKVHVIAAIDHNVASGVARTSKEIMADLVVAEWPGRAGLLEKLIGEDLDILIANMDKTLFVCQLEKPLIANKRIVLIAPPLAEHENGFEGWLQKIAKLAQELSVPVHFYGDARTHEAVQKLIKKSGYSAGFQFVVFTDWEDFLVLSRTIQDQDLLVLASSRRGSVSHQSLLDNLPAKMERYFAENNKIVIYPKPFAFESGMHEGYEDIPTGPINKGIETLGKGIESIFKR